MPLNWNIENCTNWKELGMRRQWPTTDALIWATMAIGIGEITEQNYEEFYRRLHTIEETAGTFLNHEGKPSFITLAEVKRRIGLRTNAGLITKKTFDKKHPNKKAPATN